MGPSKPTKADQVKALRTVEWYLSTQYFIIFFIHMKLFSKIKKKKNSLIFFSRQWHLKEKQKLSRVLQHAP